MVLSSTSLAPPSTMKIESREAAMTMSRSPCSRSVSLGLAISLPPTRPTRTPANWKGKGMSLTASAKEAPVSASTSVSCSLSAEKTVAMICVSKP